MTRIYCSKIFEVFLGDLISQELTKVQNDFGNWNARLFLVNRKKYLLFSNDKTAYSIIFSDIKKTDLKKFQKRFTDSLIEQLKIDIDLSYDQEKKIRESLIELKYFPTNNNKSLIGAMNEFVSIVRFDLDWHNEKNMSDVLISSKLNNYLIGSKLALNKGIYFYPKDLMKKLVAEIM